METENVMQGLGSLFETMPIVDDEKPIRYVEAYGYMRGAIDALRGVDIPAEQKREILLGLVRPCKESMEPMQYVGIIGSIFDL